MSLRCSSVDVAFGNTTFLKDVNLHLKSPRVALLYGPSGHGKTSLFNVLGGIQHPSNTARARVFWGEYPVIPGTNTDRERSHRLGLIFSSFNFLFGLSAQENITLPAVLAGKSGNFIKQRLKLLCQQFAFNDRQKFLDLESILQTKKVATLSNGQKEILAIARALLIQPPFLLADEMLRSFDDETASRVWDRLFHPDLGLGQDMGLLFITHKDRLAQDTRVNEVYTIDHINHRVVRVGG